MQKISRAERREVSCCNYSEGTSMKWEALSVIVAYARSSDGEVRVEGDDLRGRKLCASW